MDWSVVALAIVGLIAAWLFGSVIARVGGIVLCLLSLLVMGMSSPPLGVFGFVLGAALWLFGHWLFAYKHHGFRSALAHRIFNGPLRKLDPTRRWHVGVVDYSGD